MSGQAEPPSLFVGAPRRRSVPLRAAPPARGLRLRSTGQPGPGGRARGRPAAMRHDPRHPDWWGQAGTAQSRLCRSNPVLRKIKSTAPSQMPPVEFDPMRPRLRPRDGDSQGRGGDACAPFRPVTAGLRELRPVKLVLRRPRTLPALPSPAAPGPRSRPAGQPHLPCRWAPCCAGESPARTVRCARS